MNRYATYLAGGALLATTALASGTVSVQAATIFSDTLNGTNTSVQATTAFVTKELATSVFGGTASQNSAVNVSIPFIVAGSNSYAASSTTMQLNITGAEFVTTPVPVFNAYHSQTNGSGSTTVSLVGTIGSGILMFTDHVILTTIPLTWSAIEAVGVQTRNLQGLATAGSVALTGTVYNAAQTATFENITSKNILASKTPLSFAFTSASTTASNSTTPAFANFGSSTSLTLAAGTISLTQATGFATDLSTRITGSNSVSSVEIRIAHASLLDAAFSQVSIATSTGGQIGAVKSTGSIASGVATFTITATTSFDNSEAITVNLQFNGTTSIGGTSGTQPVTATATGQQNYSAPAAATGSLGNITRGGLSSQVNAFQNSFNSIPSLLRIANSSTNAGTYTIVVRQGDASASNAGAALGTYTGGSIAPGSTLQLGAGTIETGASIATPTTFGNYTLVVSASFNGYIQNLSFGGGIVSNLSAFRQGTGSGGGNP